jgi:hypothetical protein
LGLSEALTLIVQTCQCTAIIVLRFQSQAAGLTGAGQAK